MKASELVQQIERLIAERGDCEVLVPIMFDGYSPYVSVHLIEGTKCFAVKGKYRKDDSNENRG